ncbi:ROK family transcriptional regulator [Aneurinibacillus tyrosinisolvens]|uniref:ROK family transcriptional regulator n=1 Tax=Aneurinibacillus tyrosinisolvens TaxID=1443435 RepID=UPI00063F530C|nr:ROK family transcriptional regulator [Aneurinibacillus tyrosinisolvens]
MNTTGNLDLIKKMNRSLVLETVRSHQPISRAALSRKLGLSRSTISSIVDELLSKKFVIELGLGDSTKEGGRRGMELGFNPMSAFGLGLDIGDNRILHIVTDLNGEIVFEKECPATSNIKQMINNIHNFIRESGIEQHLLLGIGIAVPSIVNGNKEVVVDAPALGWKDINLKEEMKAHFPFPVFVNNDVNCAALGERWVGQGAQTNDMFFISIGTGVGSAIIANGGLVQGHQFSAGEIGYFLDKEDIEEKDINQFGGFGIFERKISELIGCMHHSREASSQLTLYLSLVLSNVVSLLNPERVIIGGPMALSLSPIIEEIRNRVALLSPLKTNIELACLDDRASALGAVSYVFEQIQENIII